MNDLLKAVKAIESSKRLLFIYLFNYLFIYSFVYLFIYLIVYLFIYLSIYLFIYLFRKIKPIKYKIKSIKT